MNADLNEIRQAYPEFKDYSDQELAPVLHESLYPEIPQKEFYREIKFNPNSPEYNMTQPGDYRNPIDAGGDAARGLPQSLVDAGTALFKGVPSMAMHPIESAKGFAAGTMSGLNTLVQNLPNNLVEYLREHQANKMRQTEEVNVGRRAAGKQEVPNTDWQLPEGISGNWASDEQKELMNAFTEKYSPDFERSAGSDLANTFGKYAPATTFSTAITGSPIFGIGAQAIAENQNPIKEILTAKVMGKAGKTIFDKGKSVASSEGAKAAAQSVKAAAQSVKEAASKANPLEIRAKKKAAAKEAEATAQKAEVAKEAKIASENEAAGKAIREAQEKSTKLDSRIQEHTDKIQELAKSLLDMDRQKNRTETTMTEAQKRVAKETGKALQAESTQVSETANKIKQYAPTNEAAAHATLHKSITEKAKELHAEASKRFDDVYSEPVGNKTLGTQPTRSLTTSDITEGKLYNEALRYLESVNSPAPYKFTQPGARASTVREMVDFAKLVQREQLKAGKQASNDSLKTSEKNKASNAIKPLKELKERLLEDVRSNVTPKQYANIMDAYTNWGDYVTPFNVHPFLNDASAPFGKVRTVNAFKALNKLNQPKLTARLMQDPTVSEAMAKFDLINFDSIKASNIKKLLDSDQGRALPQEAKALLNEQLKNLKEVEKSEVLANEISNTELKSIINEPRIREILKNDPSILKDLSDIKTLKAAISKLEAAMKEAKFTEREITQKTNALKRDLTSLNSQIKSMEALETQRLATQEATAKADKAEIDAASAEKAKAKLKKLERFKSLGSYLKWALVYGSARLL